MALNFKLQVNKEGPERGGGSDPISQCFFMKNPIPIKDFFKIPTRISNVVYHFIIWLCLTRTGN